MNKIYNWLFGPKPTPTKTLDTANTAPLSDQQLQAIVSNQNPRFDMQQLIAAGGQSVGMRRLTAAIVVTRRALTGFRPSALSGFRSLMAG